MPQAVPFCPDACGNRGGPASVYRTMKFSRAFGMVDMVVVIMALVAILLPARVMYADSALKGVDSDHRFGLALQEARTIAHPDDGGATANLTRLLDTANFKDWAIEVAVHGSERAKGSPSRWRALSAAAGAYTDKLEIDLAIDYTKQALAACELVGTVECPAWESLPLELFVRHLEAGKASGKDPHSDPDGFRLEGEAAIRSVRLGAPPPKNPTP